MHYYLLSIIVLENIINYDAPRGEVREPDVDLEDISYDGVLNGNMMKGGLGQLVDGLYGDDDYQKQLQGEHSGMKNITQRDIYNFYVTTFLAQFNSLVLILIYIDHVTVKLMVTRARVTDRDA